MIELPTMLADEGGASLVRLLAGVAGVSTALAVAFGARLVLLRAKHDHRPQWGDWPVRLAEPDEIDAVFERGPLGPGRQSEVSFISGWAVPAGTSDREAWVLCVLAKKARTIFEFGTCTGKTTYLLAANSPPDAVVHTLTLSPDDIKEYRRGGRDDAHATRTAIAASRFSSYYYEDTPVAEKVRQHFGDSKAFDHSALRGKCDLIFVDGSHAYSYVVADSEKSLEMLAPGGVCVWHDYRGPHRPKGVYKALNELSRRIELRHVAGTSLVVYRKPV